MNAHLYLAFFVFPFAMMGIMWIVLVFFNKETTGEIKRVFPSGMLLKVFALFMIVSAVFIMGMEKIINESTVSALLGAIASGVLGASFSGKKEED